MQVKKQCKKTNFVICDRLHNKGDVEAQVRLDLKHVGKTKKCIKAMFDFL